VTAAIDWDKWVAIGTLALAGATFAAVLVGLRTARLTRRLADAAQVTAQADTRALENSVRPLLLPVPELAGPTEGLSFRNVGVEHGAQVMPAAIYIERPAEARWLISVPVRNAGVGPAVIAAPHPWIQLPNDPAVKQGQATNRVVPVNERTRLNFSIVTERPDKFYAQVAYTDVDGGQLRRTEIAVSRTDGGAYEVVGFALYDGADGDFIVASGRGWDVPLRKREWW
jgi:hypothetical protein